MYKIIFICLALFISNYCVAASESTSSKSTSSKSALSFEQIKMAAENGDADAQYALGYLYYYGKDGAVKDDVLAKKWISKAAQQNQSQAVKALALMNGRQKTQTATAETKSVAVNEKEAAASDAEDSPAEVTSSKKKQVASTMKESKENKDDKEKMTLVDMKHKKASSEDEATVAANEVTDAFTLQILGSSQKDQITKLITQHHLSSNAKIYRTTLNGKDWFVLVYGQYKNKADAKTAAKKLEQELSLKPWVKPSSSLKQYKLVTVS